MSTAPVRLYPRANRLKTCFGSAIPISNSPHPTPSFLCKLVDDVVYWNTSFLSG